MQKQTMLFPLERRKRFWKSWKKKEESLYLIFNECFLSGMRLQKKIWHCLKAIINSNVFTVARYH